MYATEEEHTDCERLLVGNGEGNVRDKIFRFLLLSFALKLLICVTLTKIYKYMCIAC
jgi:hypothetical protein